MPVERDIFGRLELSTRGLRFIDRFDDDRAGAGLDRGLDATAFDELLGGGCDQRILQARAADACFKARHVFPQLTFSGAF